MKRWTIFVTFSIARRGAECFVARYCKIFHIRWLEGKEREGRVGGDFFSRPKRSLHPKVWGQHLSTVFKATTTLKPSRFLCLCRRAVLMEMVWWSQPGLSLSSPTSRLRGRAGSASAGHLANSYIMDWIRGSHGAACEVAVLWSATPCSLVNIDVSEVCAQSPSSESRRNASTYQITWRYSSRGSNRYSHCPYTDGILRLKRHVVKEEIKQKTETQNKGRN
jgi:hypothetical protein